MAQRRILFDTRYLGVVLVALGLFTALLNYSMTANALRLADESHPSCGTAEECPHVAILNQSYIGYSFSIVLFLLGLFLVVFGGKPETIETGKDHWQKVLSGLSGDEKDIYSIIMDSGGVMFQSELVQKTGMPKAKVSRVLDKMEARQIIERKRRGMTNAVVLK